jgi:hypothetical protein
MVYKGIGPETRESADAMHDMKKGAKDGHGHMDQAGITQGEDNVIVS